ncbi:polysaccharide biosynthesis protein [Pseudoxanthomonas putridarboris]|uniref:Polysaccharide biosynthesis protein n=1 Tax=Pseudoxanthomonas putridarboris TaxID=752605 RepID=A0ABU9IZ50_9GAMM
MNRALRPVPGAREGTGTSIAPRSATTALTPSQLEDRNTIYRSDQQRREVDAFRELRTQLLAAAQGNFITLVVPVSRGSGGSFVARNLAAAMAFDESKNVILVDCDVRHPSQDKSMRLAPAGSGLIDYLELREAEADNLLYSTGIARLQLLPTGTARETGAEHFSSHRMRLLLDTLRSRDPSSHIFMDGPPVRGAPDARILADLADVVVLVAGYGRDTPATIAEAAGNFDKQKFAGVVFNEGV